MYINEKMGVPDGIEKQGQLLYDKIIRSVEEGDGYIPTSLLLGMEEGDVATKLLTTFNINIKDLIIRHMPVKIKYTKYPVNKPSISGLSVGIPNYPYVNKDRIKLKYNVTSSELYIDLSFYEVNIDEIKSTLLSIKPEIISHELMHLYDSFKSKEDSMDKLIEYGSYIEIGNFPRDISLFLYLLYYTSSKENLVRPTELYHKLLDNKITKDDFYEFVNKSDIMSTIKSAIDFDLGKFINKLDKNPEVIDIIDTISQDGRYVRIGSYGIDIMNILFNQISVGGVESAKNIIQHYNKRFRDPSIGDDILYDNFNSVISKYDKYSKNPIKFFEYLEKKLNFDGRKMKRKLYKLYDMVENTENKDSKSILDWELHNKINSKNEKLITKYPDFSKIKLDLEKKKK